MVRHPKVAIRSQGFGVYVQLDGRGITEYRVQPYQNTVRTAGHALGWETFNLHYNNDDTVSFESSYFPGVYLSLDGNGVNAGVGTDFGGRSLAAQFGAYAWEKYRIRHTHGGTVAIESAAFGGRYIRVDGNANVVNVQGVAREWEHFEIVVIG